MVKLRDVIFFLTIAPLKKILEGKRIFDIAFESKIFKKSPFHRFRENGGRYGRSDCLTPSKHPP